MGKITKGNNPCTKPFYTEDMLMETISAI